MSPALRTNACSRAATLASRVIAQPMRVPAWPVSLESVKSATSDGPSSAVRGAEIGVKCGQKYAESKTARAPAPLTRGARSAPSGLFGLVTYSMTRRPAAACALGGSGWCSGASQRKRGRELLKNVAGPS